MQSKASEAFGDFVYLRKFMNRHQSHGLPQVRVIGAGDDLVSGLEQSERFERGPLIAVIKQVAAGDASHHHGDFLQRFEK